MPGKNLTTYWPQSPRVIENSVCFMRLTIRIKNKADRASYLPLSSRSGEIRTRDPLNPIQVRYQTALHPVIGSNRCYYSHSVSLCQHLFFLNLKSLDFYEFDDESLDTAQIIPPSHSRRILCPIRFPSPSSLKPCALVNWANKLFSRVRFLSPGSLLPAPSRPVLPSTMERKPPETGMSAGNIEKQRNQMTLSMDCSWWTL